MRRSPDTDREAVGDWREILEALPDAACVVDGRGRIVFANLRLRSMTGYAEGSLEGQSVHVLVPEAHRAEHRQAVRRYAAAPAARTMGERRSTSCRRADGLSFPADIALAPLAHGDETWTIAVLRDATDRQRTEEELFRQATHDALTGLANRALLLDRLTSMCRRRSRQRRPLTVLFLDLDHFKAVNDTAGHAAGDAVLCAVADALTSTFRPSDTVARVGGDEFVIVCDDTTLEEGAVLADRALVAVRSRVHELPHEAAGRVTASVGAVCARPEEEPEQIIVRADAAMYAAKQGGGDRLLVA